MSPSAMVRQAQALGLSVLALTDHNSTRNMPAFDACCREAGIFPVYGIEVTTREEIHAVCLFDQIHTALRFGKFIESLLPDVPNNPDLFGDQVYVDRHENILGEVEKSLAQAAEITFEQLHEEVSSWNGMFIPAHIDRHAFSVTSQLGFLPENTYTAVESVRIPCPFTTYANPVITNSDAHYLADMGVRSWEIELTECSYQGISRALERRNYRLKSG